MIIFGTIKRVALWQIPRLTVIAIILASIPISILIVMLWS